MLVKIALQSTFNFLVQLNNKIHKNWFSVNIDKTTVTMIHSVNSKYIYKRPFMAIPVLKFIQRECKYFQGSNHQITV